MYLGLLSIVYNIPTRLVIKLMGVLHGSKAGLLAAQMKGIIFRLLMHFCVAGSM
jgi:hypothetical protein